MGAVEFAQIAVERSQWAVARLPRHFHHQTVREADGRTTPKLRDGRADGLRILQRQLLVIQEQLDRCRNGLGAPGVHGGQDPRSFGERQVWHPGSAGDKGLGRRYLLGIVSGDEADQHVGINGSHGAS